MSSKAMGPGVVALIDALAFKGIWKRVERPEVVFEQMQALVASMTRYEGILRARDDWFARRRRFPVVRFLSDSLFVGLRANSILVKGSEDDRVKQDLQALALRTIAALCGRFCRDAAKLECPLAYRGVITVGEFGVDGNFLAGPAVDEAAEMFEQANGALIWLSPSALKVYEERMLLTFSKEHQDPLLMRWDVPLKGGQSFSTRVLNPVSVSTKRTETIEAILSTFSPRPGTPQSIDVAIKHQNTMAFLTAVLSRLKGKTLTA